MKIEKVNDHQIRCTLTRDDLAKREIKVSELAYGTDKAKELFREMMQQASSEFGFEADDIPLMIEAIPINSDCIVLIITKVEDPEELDTRFSNFSPSVEDELEDDSEESTDDDVMGLFKRLQQGDISGFFDNASNPAFQSDSKKVKEKKGNKKTDNEHSESSIAMYAFNSLHEITMFAGVVNKKFNVRNTLYKDSSSGDYYLVLYHDSMDNESYEKICTILSEYGSEVFSSAAGETYLDEHYKVVIKDNAIQTLAKI
ncbi:MAG: adaptor protein MecA [Butyrivibrio sp.]|nr:adaptor protein MecA [Butyrivibrio sp.]